MRQETSIGRVFNQNNSPDCPLHESITKSILVKTRILQTCFAIIFIIIAFNKAIAQQPSVSSNIDYFDYITLFSQGRITRFTQMPIRVYISPVLKESPYLPEIRYAMQAWHTASDGDIQFEETETPQNTDIRVSWGYTGFHGLSGHQTRQCGTHAPPE